MFMTGLVVLTFGAAKTAYILSKRSCQRDKQRQVAGLDVKHTEQWKTCALDAATFVAVCVAMGAAGVLTDEMRDQDRAIILKSNITSSQAQVLH